jgi:hypothetical protein
VQWLDSESSDGWKSADTMYLGPEPARTIGFLAREDKTSLSISATYQAGPMYRSPFQGYITIPKRAILKRGTVTVKWPNPAR